MNYILISRNRYGHGIHSPFVFDLVSRVFRKKAGFDDVSAIEMIRGKMISDKRYIDVKDLGSGCSKVNLRRVSAIARKSPVPVKYGHFLSAMATEYGKPLIIELGTSLGISSMYMAMSATGTEVHTIEGCPALASMARQNFSDLGLSNIKVIEGSFDDKLPLFFKTGVRPGLVFIDGDHRKESVLRYFYAIAGMSGPNTVIIIDDISNSKEMAEAWNEIRVHEKVTLSVDIHRMGILFFREGITCNNYVIRY